MLSACELPAGAGVRGMWQIRALALGHDAVFPLTLHTLLPDLADLSGEGLDIVAFREQIEEAIDLSQDMVADGEAHPIDWAIFNDAISTVLRLAGNPPASCPLILPLWNGGIGVEWHDRGLNIELRFRAATETYVVIEDAMVVVQAYHGMDPEFAHAELALGELRRRGAVSSAVVMHGPAPRITDATDSLIRRVHKQLAEAVPQDHRRGSSYP